MCIRDRSCTGYGVTNGVAIGSAAGVSVGVIVGSIVAAVAVVTASPVAISLSPLCAAAQMCIRDSLTTDRQ